MDKEHEDDSKWTRSFVSLYLKAEPLVRHIANADKLAAGELPVSPSMLVESNLTLKPVLAALRKLRQPKSKELVEVHRQYQTVLLQCIRAAEYAEKYINNTGNLDRYTLMGMIVNSIMLAREYNETVSLKIPLLTNIVMPGI